MAEQTNEYTAMGQRQLMEEYSLTLTHITQQTEFLQRLMEATQAKQIKDLDLRQERRVATGLINSQRMRAEGLLRTSHLKLDMLMPNLLSKISHSLVYCAHKSCEFAKFTSVKLT